MSTVTQPNDGFAAGAPTLMPYAHTEWVPWLTVTGTENPCRLPNAGKVEAMSGRSTSAVYTPA
ncbi:unannotated protein [freshwater metagenome]|uniref:Unannotated protein n=1 Tax=freshwater metagenome TaxID=449393 RepID=A0A6J7GL92_9ZZZZ